MKELTQREMAQLGGHARARSMSKRARTENARYAAIMRWSNNKKKGKKK